MGITCLIYLKDLSVLFLHRWLLLRFDALGGLAVLFTTILSLSGAIGAGQYISNYVDECLTV